MVYQYEYPRPMTTVDILVIRFTEDVLEVLLIQRGNEPFKGRWALPGGYIDMDEKLVESARRELFEETGIEMRELIPLFSAGDPGRDPRGRTITQVYAAIMSSSHIQGTAGDDARAIQWFPLTQLPPLAFDHDKIVRKAVEELQFQGLWRFWILLFLPEKFHFSQYEKLIQKLYDHALLPERLMEKAQKLSFVRPTRLPGQFQRVAAENIIGASLRQLLDVWISDAD
ncbi:MAG: NUDIX domain-containing protein [Calditrichia bacterium]